MGAHEIAVGVFCGLLFWRAFDTFLDFVAWASVRPYFWVRSFGK